MKVCCYYLCGAACCGALTAKVDIFDSFSTSLVQTFYCGYSVIISTLAKWFRWGATVNPGTYAMAAWYQNELKNNGFKDFEEFADFFEWDRSLQSCLFYLLVFVGVNKLLLYLVLSVTKAKKL